tara:strand:- start:785 stop:1369 length:585 start_codon:yes stop_codon:yes gene_type:complete
MRHSNQRRSRSGRPSGKRQYNNGHNRNYESNGAGSKLRGSASQVFDKYLALARDASSAGDRVAAENFFQHAEHYFRINSIINAEKRAKDLEKESDENTVNKNGINKNDKDLINQTAKSESESDLEVNTKFEIKANRNNNGINKASSDNSDQTPKIEAEASSEDDNKESSRPKPRRKRKKPSELSSKSSDSEILT